MTDPQTLPQSPSLSLPEVVEPLDFERIYTDTRADLQTRAPELAGVLALESEPLTKLLQAGAYRELLYRQRVNEALRSRLLAFATAGALDHLGAFYGVARLSSEGDDRLRRRIQLRIRSLAGHGTKEGYEEIALATSLDVRDALAVRNRPGYVQVLVWPHTNAANPQDLRLAVYQALTAHNVHTLGVQVTVALAKPRALHITAQVWRDAMAPADLVTRAVAHLSQALPTYARLGRAVPRSWITSQLHAVGCAAVQYPDPAAPAEQTPLAWDEYPAAGLLQLSDMGTMA